MCVVNIVGQVKQKKLSGHAVQMKVPNWFETETQVALESSMCYKFISLNPLLKFVVRYIGTVGGRKQTGQSFGI